MQNSINIYGENLSYFLKESLRAKRVRITINHDGSIIVIKPKRVSMKIVEKFLIAKSGWIFDKVKWFKNFKDKINTKINIQPNISNIKNARQEYLENKDKALKLSQERLEYFNKFYNFKWNNITIKNQKTRWGSCSRKGNLNFNYKIALLPQKMSDYIIVHELCHLKEFNHSKNFWSLVGKTIPDYLEIRKELKGRLF